MKCSSFIFIVISNTISVADRPIQNPHPATRNRDDIVTTSLYTSQRRRRYVSNETTNDALVEHRQDVSVVRLQDILLERLNDVLRGGNNDVSSVRLHNVSNKSQMKRPMALLWYVFTTSWSYVVATPCQKASTLLCHELHVVGFHVSFKYQVKHQIFLVPARREAIRVV